MNNNSSFFIGGLAQLARACGWQPQGQGFDSPNLHVRPPYPPGGGDGGFFLFVPFYSLKLFPTTEEESRIKLVALSMERFSLHSILHYKTLLSG